jgi:hypothetical protein
MLRKEKKKYSKEKLVFLYLHTTLQKAEQPDPSEASG